MDNRPQSIMIDSWFALCRLFFKVSEGLEKARVSIYYIDIIVGGR